MAANPIDEAVVKFDLLLQRLRGQLADSSSAFAYVIMRDLCNELGDIYAALTAAQQQGQAVAQRLATPEHIGLYQGPDDCPHLQLNGVSVAIFPAGSWSDVCSALGSITGSTAPPSAPEQKKLHVGNLPTLTDSEYPGLGDWWVQLWDGDGVFARAFGASPEEARRRAERIRDALAQQPAAVDEKYSELIYAVSRKYPGESRHETALRYIRQAESADHGPAQAATQRQEPKS